ncbi:hypothetical protein D3C76_1328360 [compost metagenome]
MRLTLIKASLFPDPRQDLGEHQFTYSLLPHEGDWLQGDTVKEAWDLNQPLTVHFGKADRPEFSLFSLSGDHVMIDAVKKAEDLDAVVLRIHEFAGVRGEIAISSDLSIDWWQECNLMEIPLGESHIGEPEKILLKPYEIKTLIVAFR